MRFRLRTLLIVLAVGPVVLAGTWWKYSAWRTEQSRLRAIEAENARMFGPGQYDPIITDWRDQTETVSPLP